MKGFKKDGKFRPTGNKTKSSLKKSDITRKTKIRNKTTWEAKLEEPVMEEGTTTHTFELGDEAGEHEVKNALMRMTLPDGSFRYHEQDVNSPYLHYIKKIASDNDEMKTKNPNPNKQFNTTEMTEFLEKFLIHDNIVNGTMSEFYRDDELEALEERNDKEGMEEYEEKYEQQGLWACGECDSEMPNGESAFSYHYYEENGGVNPDMEKILNDHGWWFEWHDAGTIMLYQNDNS